MEGIEKRIPLICPSCDSPLHVAKMHCDTCRTEVNGSYELPLLARFPEKEQQFILEFVKSSGSLKDMARQLEISYPTVRNLLDDLIKKMEHTL